MTPVKYENIFVQNFIIEAEVSVKLQYKSTQN